MSHGPSLVGAYTDKGAFRHMLIELVRKTLDHEPGQLSTVDLVERIWPRYSVPGDTIRDQFAQTVRQAVFKELPKLAARELKNYATQLTDGQTTRFGGKPWRWHMSLTAPAAPVERKCPHCGGIL